MKMENEIDKSGWGIGPWNDEPDKLEGVDKETKLDCLILRHESIGHLCGYVGINKDHKLFKAEYSACFLKENCGKSYCDHTLDLIIDVHGGLTFSNSIPESSIKDLWWFGFDCSHSGDLAPGMNRFLGMTGGIYRDIDYVKQECEKLAKQLHDH